MRGSAVFRTGVAPGGALAGPWVRNSLWTAARAVPSLDLRFADNKSLVDATTGASLVTFTRASSGTFVGSDGVLKTAVTNLLLRSEEFQTTWTSSQLLAFGSGSVTDATTAPNGTLTADRITENTATAQRFVSQGVSGIPASSVITVSCYVKFDSANRNFSLQLTDAPSGGSGYAELYLTQSGVVTSPTPSSFTNRTATVENVGSGWYRVRLTITTAAVTTITTRLFIVSSANAQSYTGDGTSGLFVWGAQLEQSATVGEYIPTTSAINSAPRFDHNPTTGESLGLLVEEARTNIALRSEEFNDASWTKTRSSITTNAVVAPDGIATADKLIASVDTNTHFVVQNVTLTVAAWTFSVFLKQAEYTSARILVFDGTATTYGAIFNLSAGTLTSTSNSPLATSINASGNGFWRCSITVTGTVVAGNVQIRPVSGGTDNFTGDGTSGIYTWGAMVEAGAFPTSYIPTTTATVTRAADVASITGTNFSSWYNQTEGTVFADARTQQSSSAHVLAGVSTGSFASSAYLSKESSNFLVAAPDAAPSNINIGLLSVSSNVGLRAALAFTAGTGSASAVMNGGTVGTDASTGIPITMSQMAIGSAPWSIGSNPWNGTIKRLTCWPTRLATLQAITQP